MYQDHTYTEDIQPAIFTTYEKVKVELNPAEHAGTKVASNYVRRNAD